MARDIEFATSTGDRSLESWNWTGWRRRHWPAAIERWVGRKIYIFDKESRTFTAIVEVTYGGEFPYRTWFDFRNQAKKLCKWDPSSEQHKEGMPFASKNERPCIGFALRWNKVKDVEIPCRIARFPRIGWLRLNNQNRNDVLDTADLFPESGYSLKAHKQFERNPELRRAAKHYWQKKQNGRIKCVICTFDFEKNYGKHGAEFIEMHHKEYLYGSPKRQMKVVTDLIPVCSNCHRMIHRRRNEPMSPRRLAALFKSCNSL